MYGPYQIVEGVEGYWHYHLAPFPGNQNRSLCGRRTMITGMRLRAWGHVTDHIRQRYCDECERIAGEQMASRETEGN